MRLRTGIVWFVVVVIAAGAAGILPAYHTECWIDPVTGSGRGRTVWPFGLIRGWRYYASPLETKLTQIGYSRPQSWVFKSRDGYTLFGHGTMYEDGPRYPIKGLKDGMEEVIAGLSADELEQFAYTMLEPELTSSRPR